MKRALATALAAVISLICYACGGGGCSNDCPPEVPTPTADCKAKPEACK